jgi:hypothetical protein
MIATVDIVKSRNCLQFDDYQILDYKIDSLPMDLKAPIRHCDRFL